MENTTTSKINNDKTLETSLDELYQSYSQIDALSPIMQN